jgi:hypothetical protein
LKKRKKETSGQNQKPVKNHRENEHIRSENSEPVKQSKKSDRTFQKLPKSGCKEKQTWPTESPK